MAADDEHAGLVPSRGVLLIKDFCRHTGLDQAVVAGLMRSERIRGGLWRDEAQTRLFGLFDDVLPTTAELEALGLAVSDGYDPDSLRSS
ncbi:hypothetical protein I601_3525 [Nocardioides dokdonensis FR1436]|uniref:Uncharacterized protein n=1 Tax=Nocardioides dokdonensis FR1436 TaxID=1300347 RepID=A0A1A9GR36_9ACTN|nr:hypothetical protein [Nocardioides dokdonensis]ANH39931.1 hypothetical protein I601_3525 [Nocardioides dokdonensis FR1436]